MKIFYSGGCIQKIIEVKNDIYIKWNGLWREYIKELVNYENFFKFI